MKIDESKFTAVKFYINDREVKYKVRLVDNILYRFCGDNITLLPVSPVIAEKLGFSNTEENLNSRYMCPYCFSDKFSIGHEDCDYYEGRFTCSCGFAFTTLF